MKDYFNITSHNEDTVKQVIKEANIMLASIAEKYGEKRIEFTSAKAHYNALINVHKSLQDNGCNSLTKHKNILLDMTAIFNHGLLSPLTLEDNEFHEVSHGHGVNKRYDHIYRQYIVNSYEYFHEKAFNVTVKALYNDDTNKEVEHSNITYVGNTRVYITKGGTTTGEYFNLCKIRQEIVDRKHFVVRDPINIPVSKIINGVDEIFCIDSREPKFKALKEFYDVPIFTNEEMKGKFDIRRYEKLKKKTS